MLLKVCSYCYCDDKENDDDKVEHADVFVDQKGHRTMVLGGICIILGGSRG